MDLANLTEEDMRNWSVDLEDYDLEGEDIVEGEGQESPTERNQTETDHIQLQACLKFEVGLSFNIGFPDFEENIAQNLSDAEYFMKKIGAQDYTSWSVASHNQKQVIVNFNLALG